MAIAFSCPACDRAYSVDDTFAGKSTACKGCRERIVIPAAPPPVARARVVRAAPAAEPEDDGFEVIDEPEDKPARPRRVFADDAPTPAHESAAKVAARKAMKQARRQERIDEDRYRYRPSSLAVSRAVIGGVITMVFAAVWFFGGLAFGVIFFFPPILFVGGLVSLIRGLLGHEE